MTAMENWFDVLADRPATSIVSALGLLAAAAIAGIALRAVTRRTRSLRQLVLAIAIASLAIGAVAAFLLGRLMVLDRAEANAALVVLGVTAVFAALLALFASKPLGDDAKRLETVVRRLESGDRTARTDVDRAVCKVIESQGNLAKGDRVASQL